MKIGRLLKQQMQDKARDSREAGAERVRHRAAAEQAHLEMLAKFSPLTSENALEAVQWQEARIAEILEGR